MRVVTWNAEANPSITLPKTAQHIFAQTIQVATDAFAPDIAVFQEIPNPFTPNSPTQFWHGPITARGVAVCVQPPFTLTPLFSTPPQSVFPFRIEGPVNFTLLAVWSLPPKEHPPMKDYVREVMDGIAQCRNLLRAGPAVIVGDFNSNSRWDAETGSVSHSALVRTLEDEFNLTSAYHQARKAAHGEEVEPTFYHHRWQTAPSHIDYCFVPAIWKIDAVAVGTFADWSTRSDHCPLVVDVAP